MNQKHSVTFKGAATRAYRNIRQREQFEVLTRGVRFVDARHLEGSAWAKIVALFERKVPGYFVPVKSIHIKIWSAIPSWHLACASLVGLSHVLLKD